METKPKTSMQVRLSCLWLFALLNYLYADLMTLMDPAVLKKILAGGVDSVPMTPEFLLIAAVLMETAIAMTVLPRFLPHRLNRWANIGFGLVHTAAVAGSLFVAPPAVYYVFFAVIEMACTLFIIGVAWNWRPERAAGAVEGVRK